MAVRSFLESLLDSGRVRVGDTDESLDAGEEIKDILESLDERARLEMPGTAPPLTLEAAAWAARLFYRACQFLVCRAVEPTLIQRTLSEPCPVPCSPGVIYSVDLVFRYLPDLLILARAVSTDDPLVTALVALAGQWPLSSVGIKGVAPGDIEPIAGHPSLWQLYVDRVLERGDMGRLSDARVRTAAAVALGLHRELCPSFPSEQ